ncbi:PhzF family phenazine biosynthesis protein [Pseudoduganella eburnea]|uniref:PhzF family phenazine biosynthesis protein n=1 Tax=Massilia eburnea TaxID=1776165 RepID=A0A6L6QH24_9BURK|nr:PhzF family phenazine biosynthesis protein [Massilia eburnea]MTW11374.1 PhzF family phenazine biosynthesis protein [Massilia eburnea]
MTISELLCFGVRPGQGNPALVIRDGGAGIAARQAFAKAANKSACVFVDAGAGDAAWTLDYFYPHTRSPLCLHATLAAARVLLADTTGPMKVRTAMRGQELVLSRNDDGFFASLSRQELPNLAPGAEPASLAELAARLLDAPRPALVSAPAVASVGSPKLLVEVADSDTLQALRPDLATIVEWGKAYGVNGIYAWCRRADGAFEGRNFNHLDPAMEDSATGVAAGALTLHLGHSLALYQGARRGQPCLIRTRLEGEQILIGGAAEYV